MAKAGTRIKKPACICSEAGTDGTHQHSKGQRIRFQHKRPPNGKVWTCNNHIINYLNSDHFELS